MKRRQHLDEQRSLQQWRYQVALLVIVMRALCHTQTDQSCICSCPDGLAADALNSTVTAPAEHQLHLQSVDNAVHFVMTWPALPVVHHTHPAASLLCALNALLG